MSLDQRSAGCRFDGHGYVISDARSMNLRHRFTVELKFKTSEPQGLLFLIGGNKTFTALELRNGKVLYQVSATDIVFESVAKNFFIRIFAKVDLCYF